MDDLKIDVMRAAVETYDLEIAVNPLNEKALESALKAALRRHEETVIAHVAEIAENYAEELLEAAEEEDEIPGPIALKWFAQKLRNDIPMLSVTNSYTPSSGDVVEVILIGQVETLEDECSNCGHMEAAGEWMITSSDGNDHFFSPGETNGQLKVRILSRKEEYE